MISRGTFLDAFRAVLRLNVRRSVRKTCGLSRSKIFRRPGEEFWPNMAQRL